LPIRVSQARWGLRLRPVDRAYRAATRVVRAAFGRTVELSRAALFFRLARRQDPLQTDGHWGPMGGLAAPSDHAGRYALFWAAGETTVARTPLLRILLCRGGALGLLFGRSSQCHQHR